MKQYDEFKQKFTKDGVTDYLAMISEVENNIRNGTPIFMDVSTLAIIGFLKQNAESSSRGTTMTIKQDGDISITYHSSIYKNK